MSRPLSLKAFGMYAAGSVPVPRMSRLLHAAAIGRRLFEATDKEEEKASL